MLAIISLTAPSKGFRERAHIHIIDENFILGSQNEIKSVKFMLIFKIS